MLLLAHPHVIFTFLAPADNYWSAIDWLAWWFPLPPSFPSLQNSYLGAQCQTKPLGIKKKLRAPKPDIHVSIFPEKGQMTGKLWAWSVAQFGCFTGLTNIVGVWMPVGRTSFLFYTHGSITMTWSWFPKIQTVQDQQDAPSLHLLHKHDWSWSFWNQSDKWHPASQGTWFKPSMSLTAVHNCPLGSCKETFV